MHGALLCATEKANKPFFAECDQQKTKYSEYGTFKFEWLPKSALIKSLGPHNAKHNVQVI